MALKIRLARHGAKKRPFYWVVVADARAPRDGRYTEKVGTYDPQGRSSSDILVLKEDRIRHWIACGAQATDRVRRFLGDRGILPKVDVRATPQKSAPKKRAQERAKEEAKRAAASASAESNA